MVDSELPHHDADEPVELDVLGYDYPCERCHMSFRWVVGFAHSAFGEPCFAGVDTQFAVTAARQMLQAAGEDELANQLVDRPPALRRAGFNPNRCPACAWPAGWHYFEEVVVNRAYHEQWTVLVTQVMRFAEVESIAPSSAR